LDAEGNEILYDEASVSFTLNPPSELGSFRQQDIEPVKAFFTRLNQYLADSALLFTTDQEYMAKVFPDRQQGYLYGTQDVPIMGLYDYFYESADLTVDEQMERFVEYYSQEFGELAE
jgi:hypothetical protein